MKNLNYFFQFQLIPTWQKFKKKIKAKPKGFFTQVVNSKTSVERLTNFLKPNGFRIIPCLLLPSEKNSKSAEFLQIDWSDYKDNFIGFVRDVHDLAGDVLITSPNDFKGAHEALSKLAS